MISRLRGTLIARQEGLVEIATSGGVVYEVEVPLSVAERLPGVDEEVELRTVHVVREDLAALYGFMDGGERLLFQRLLSASGVGAKLALAMLSTFPATRLVRALAEEDVAALTQVSGIGKKTAERLVLDLKDRVKDLELAEGVEAGAPAQGAQAAVQALTALGMSFQEADQAVRAVLAEGEGEDPDELIRKALAQR